VSYVFHYVLWAAPFDCDEEQKAFHKVLAEFNEEAAMPNGYLLSGLTLTMPDKRSYQGAVNENLRMSRYYLQVIEDNWGPPTRDLERDWAYARRCLADPELPMREAVTLFRAPLLPHKVEPAISELKYELLACAGPHAEFTNPEQLRNVLRNLFLSWHASIMAESGLVKAGETVSSS
jgi:hypothetical protein